MLNINDSAHRTLSDLQTKLLNDFQKNFPLSPTPYADIAACLGVTETEVLAALQELEEGQIISRIGPVFHPHCIGTSTLVATVSVITARAGVHGCYKHKARWVRNRRHGA